MKKKIKINLKVTIKEDNRSKENAKVNMKKIGGLVQKKDRY